MIRSSGVKTLITEFLPVALSIFVVAGAAPGAGTDQASAATAYDWPQFDFNSQHSGNNTLETTITPANVSTLQPAFSISLPSIADGAPAYVSGVSTVNGTQDLLFVTTKDGHIIALDAHTGAQLWTQQYGPGSCHINQGSRVCYTTSSPVIDPNRQYVYSYGLDGMVHKLQVSDGTEITTGGWPELATLKAFDEKGSSALSVVSTGGVNYLYVTNGGYPGDNGDYQGHITAINLGDGSQRVFNALCSDQGNVHFLEQPSTPDCPSVQTAVWARPGVIFDADTNRIYAATGNGTFSPADHYWGDSVFALNPDASGANGDPLDTYTPTNFQQLQNNDADLGSTAPAILPAPLNSRIRHLAVQGGKDSVLRLLNLDNLSGQNGTGNTGGEIKMLNLPQGGEILTQPAVWVNRRNRTWVFVANGNGISGLILKIGKTGTPKLRVRWVRMAGGTSPIIANNVLFYAEDGNIVALNPTTGQQLWNSAQIGGIHWESPIVANGYLYITDESGSLSAFHLP